MTDVLSMEEVRVDEGRNSSADIGKSIFRLVEETVKQVKKAADDPVLGMNDVSTLINKSPKEIRKMIAAGELPAPLKTGRREAVWPEPLILRWCIAELMSRTTDDGNMTRKQILDFLQISSPTFYRMRKAGAFIVPVDGSLRYPRWRKSDVLEWQANGGFERWETIRNAQ